MDQKNLAIFRKISMVETEEVLLGVRVFFVKNECGKTWKEWNFFFFSLPMLGERSVDINKMTRFLFALVLFSVVVAASAGSLRPGIAHKIHSPGIISEYVFKLHGLHACICMCGIYEGMCACMPIAVCTNMPISLGMCV